MDEPNRRAFQRSVRSAYVACYVVHGKLCVVCGVCVLCAVCVVCVACDSCCIVLVGSRVVSWYLRHALGAGSARSCTGQ